MDLTFRGEYEYAVDDRGRVVIPPKFRETLTDTVLIGSSRREGKSGSIPRRRSSRDCTNPTGMTNQIRTRTLTRQRFWLAAKRR